jgi:hypothetical protein
MSGRGMHPDTIAVWELVRKAGPEGLLRTEIKAALPDDTEVHKRLFNLSQRGYLVHEGAGGESRYKPTSKEPCKATLATVKAGAQRSAKPVAASSPAPSTGAVDEDPEDAMRREARSKTPQGVPPGVPNSVFDLGRTLCGGKSAGLPEAAAEAAPVAAPTSAPAPAALSAAQRAGLPWNQPAQLDIPTLGKLPAHLTPRKPAAPPDAAPPEPRFELHSDGVLLIDPAGDGAEPIALHPTVTRHLFRWLDRIGGLRLSRLFECGTEATS